MSRVVPKELAKAEELLQKVQSWTEEEVEELPRFYREKAKEYRDLLQQGED